MNPFVLGVQYYGPPHTTEEDWVRDFKLIKEHGLDAIKVWAIWGYLEPAPDEFGFDEWDRMFDAAQRHGLSVMPNTAVEIQPFWIDRVFPQTNVVDHFGNPVLSTTGEYSCGISPGACLDHAGPRQQAKQFLTALASHFGDRENLLGWDAWNETRWMDNISDHVHEAFVRIPCYCERTVAKFRAWLESKYGSLSGLNETWRRKYIDWADVFPPRGGWWSYAYPEMVDWRDFMLDYVTDKLELRVQALREGDGRHPVMMHAGSPSVISPAVLGEVSSDDWKLSKVVDFYGTSFYPVWTKAGTVKAVDLNCLGLDGIRSAGQGKPFWISELQGGPSLHSPGQGNNYSPVDLRLWTFCTLAHGAKGILYWSWRPEPFGPETLGFGLCLFDGTPTDRTRMVKTVSQIVGKNESVFSQSEVYPAQAAILFDPDLYIINWCGGTGGMDRDMALNSVRGYYRAFWENNIACDFVHADQLDGLGKYRLLVMPFAFCLKKNVAQKITEYVKAGGTVVTEAYLGRFEESLVPATGVPAYGLHEVFAVRETEAEFVDSVEIAPERAEHLLEDVGSLTGYYFKEILQPLPGSEVLGSFDDGTPAITRNRYGEGQAILFGSLMALGYPEATDGGLGKLISNLSRAAGISVPVEVTASEGGLVSARVHTCDGGYVIFCLNYGEKCEATLKLHLPAPASVRELVADKPAEHSVGDNTTEIAMEMDSKDVKVFLYSAHA